MVKSYKGQFRPTNIYKYKGDHTNIIYRSLLERRYMEYFDLASNILEWSSEEIVIPYISPFDDRIHRYYPDFYIKKKESDGSILSYIVEIKPASKTKPPKIPKGRSKKYLYEQKDWIINTVKWEAAQKYCEKYNYKFLILTENNIK